jgi:glycosyltransferase involved in cell wall biosynthesis
LEVLQRVQIWNRGSSSTFALRNGPIHAVDGWRHRELPPKLVLHDVENWPEIKDPPLVTIYIPAYNVEKYIAEAIESAIAQDYPHIEVCVHDDGSTDGTLQIIEALAEQHPTIRFSSAENAGIGAASNRAINLGTGELILQLDGDDVLDPNAVTALVTAISDGAVVAYGNFRRIDPDGAFIDDGWEEPMFSRERLLRSMIVHHPRLFRRDAWERVGGHDETLTNAVDYDVFLKLSEVGRIVHLRNHLYSYRLLDTSTSRAKSTLQTKNTYVVVRSALERQGIQNFDLHVPNPSRPRAFLVVDCRFMNE